MDKTKHTLGPWTAHDDDGTGTLPCVLSDKVTAGGNFYVAQCNIFEDAVAIAAIPDLLAACLHASMSCHHPACKCHGEYSANPERYCTCHVQKARAAMDKAAGK